MEGLVLKSTGSWYTVKGEDGQLINCKIKGNFKIKGIKSTNPLAVGDKVEYVFNDDAGLITEIYDRKNYLIRKSVNLSKQTHILAANIDRAYLIATIVAPKTSLGFIDRFLLSCEAYHIPVTIVFNKADLFDNVLLQYLDDVKAIYEPIGYECLAVSSFDVKDVEMLRKRMKGGINLFSGHSGVGKSSLINAIEPLLKLKTGDISAQHLKGTHTTTFAEMHEIAGGGYIIDTPGIRDFTIISEFKKEEIGHYMPEIRGRINACKFNNCLHEHEPGCAVKKAVEEGLIHEWRYYSYLSILRNEDNYN